MAPDVVPAADPDDPPLPGSLAAIDGLDVERGAYGGPRVARLSRALRTPISALSLAELRFLLSERRGIAHLVPAALARLEVDPFLRADTHAGDLLLTTLAAADAVWDDAPPWRARVRTVLADARHRLTVDAVDFATRDRLAAELDVADARFHP